MAMLCPTTSGSEAIGPSRAGDLLAALADPACRSISAHDVAVVVAHPDDETIGCGAQLRRFVGATIVAVSNGAPADLTDATRHGFHNAADYAAAREKELFAALVLAGVPRRKVVQLRWHDQRLAFALAEIALRLEDMCCERGITVILTHPYEGGHPDHDATAFAVHATKALLRSRGHAISIMEMPFYFLGADGLTVQRFAPGFPDDDVVIHLDGEAQALKRAMIASHATQRETLSAFGAQTERFRRAPAYDFSASPNGGQLFYEQHSWGMDGERWLQLSRAALEELGLGARPWL
jgi:LmbE family N-acetylglucosaminyl deacetylase